MNGIFCAFVQSKRTFIIDEYFKARPSTAILRFKHSSMESPIESAIRTALSANLSPVHLEVINESYMHNAPKGSESHFKVLVVSSQFNDLPLIKRHRLVNDIVMRQLKGEFVHALSIEAKTPQQWKPATVVEESPKCRGGFGK